METLEDMRKSIDNIDNAIVAMFAERFKVTNRVGYFKAENKLAAKDTKREHAQYERIRDLAKIYGVETEFAEAYLQAVIQRVVAKHQQIAGNYNDSSDTL